MHLIAYSDLDNFAQKITRQVSLGDVITLSGTLGSGKTTFIKFLLKSLGYDFNLVTSPTFNLLNIYETKTFSIWHYDLYRLTNISEVFELGFEEAFLNGITIIEWPDLVEKILPKNYLAISLENDKKIDQRKYNFVGHGKWQNLIF